MLKSYSAVCGFRGADQAFAAAVNYASSGYQSTWAAVADVNGDGKPDIVVANACGDSSNCNTNGTIGVLLGNGDGTFQAAVTYDSGALGAFSVTVADVNGDGKPDLVVANNSTVSVLLGNGDGTFQAAVSYGTGGNGVHSVAVADVNGDGKPDLVVALNCGQNCGFGAVGVLLGNGDGTFQTAVTYPSGGINATSAVVEDVNGDGKPDIVVTNYTSSSGSGQGNVCVLLGNGDGTFQTAVAYGVGGDNPDSVAVADVNGDGKPDIVVTNFSSDNVGVLLGNGDGTFQTAVAYGSGGYSPDSVVVADVNGDRKPDLLVANQCVDIATCANGTVGVLLGNGDGTFQTAVAYGSGGDIAYSVAVADFNGDGEPDIVVADKCDHNCDLGSVAVLINMNPTLGLGVASGNSSSQTVTAGSTAKYTLSIGGSGLSGTVSLTCTGAPAGAACSVPSSETVSATTASTFAVSVSTAAPTSSALHRPGSSLGWMWATALIGLGLLPGGDRRKRHSALRRFVWLPLLLIVFLVACGGGSGGGGGSGSGGTPAGTYTLTVTATLNGAMQSQALKLIVQ